MKSSKKLFRAVAVAAAVSGCSVPKTGINVIDAQGAKVNASIDSGKAAINKQTDQLTIKSRQGALITKGCLAKGQDDGTRGGITKEAVQYFNEANDSNFTIDTVKKKTIIEGNVCTKTAPALAQ